MLIRQVRKRAKEGLLLKDIRVELKASLPDWTNLDEKWLELNYVTLVTELLLDHAAKEARNFASQASNPALIAAWQALEKIKHLEGVAAPVKGELPLFGFWL